MKNAKYVAPLGLVWDWVSRVSMVGSATWNTRSMTVAALVLVWL